MRIKRILAYALVVALFISMLNINVFAATSAGTKYEIAVAVDPDNSTIDLNTFEEDIKNKMVSESGNTLSASEIDINFVRSNAIKTSDQASWNIYDHYYSKNTKAAAKQMLIRKNYWNWPVERDNPSTTTKEGVPVNTTSFYTSAEDGTDYIYYRDKHVYAEGNRVTFMGYSQPAYKDFLLYPDVNSGKKTIEYSVYLDSLHTHTLAGAGFLINSEISGTGSSAVINGYMLYYDYTAGYSETNFVGDKVYLYKLTNVNADALHEGTLAIGGAGFTQAVGATNPKVSGKKVKDIKLEVSSKSIKFYEKDGTTAGASFSQVLAYDLPSVSTNYGFGPLVAYQSHGCQQLTVYTYDNISLTSNSTKKFEDKILEPRWHDGAVHALINVDDSGIVNFSNNNEKTEMLKRLLDRDVKYIGWGSTDKNQELSLIKENNKSGMYVDTSTDTGNVTFGDGSTATAVNYDAQVTEIAKYLLGLTLPTISLAPVARIAYDGTNLTSASTDPNGDTLTEFWSIKEAGDAAWSAEADSAAASALLSTTLATPEKNVLVQLVVFDGTNYSEPAVLYLSSQSNVKPVAQFSIAESIDLEDGGNQKLIPDNTSFDPYKSARTITYKWEVFNEMNRKVLTSSAIEPEFDFTGFAAGRYDVKLTASVPDGGAGAIVSGTFVQPVYIIDTVAPKMIVGLEGTSSSAIATIQIIDYGSGPDSYRVKTTDKNSVSITGPWVPASGYRTVIKTYPFVPKNLNSLAFEVKDGSGNTRDYPVNFSLPMVAYTPNGGDIYTNFTYDEDVKVTVSSLTDATVTDWYFQWLQTDDYPDSRDITVDGTHVSGTNFAYIPQPDQIGDYYLHVKAVNSENASQTTVSELFKVIVARNGVHDFHVTGFNVSGISFAWTSPAGAVAQKILYSDDNGTTWKPATHAALTGESNTALVTGLDSNNRYMFKLKVDGGEDAGESNLAYWDNLIFYASGDSAVSVTKNVTLSAITAGNATVTWSSSDTTLADKHGNIFRPSYTEGNKQVTLTATIHSGGSTYTIPFQLNVLAEAATDEEAVAQDKVNLSIIYAAGDSADNVTQNVTLPSSATPSLGSIVTWASRNPGYVTTTGAITRPNSGSGDAIVYLTATINKNTKTEMKVFKLILKEAPKSDAEAINELEIGYAPLDSASYVTRNITLPPTASNGTQVSWSSSSAATIEVDGTVTRPLSSESDTGVTLTATVGSETRVFNLTVIKAVDTADDAAAVAADKAQLDVIYADGDNDASVTKNVTLVTTLSNGSSVVWNSNTPEVIDNTGTVVRPANGNGDATVVLTADIERNGVTDSAIFTLNVKELTSGTNPQDILDVQNDVNSIQITYTDDDGADNVTKNLGLPQTGTNGSSITWSSSDPAIVDEQGNVFRPSAAQEDRTVTLTATVKKGDAVEIRTFTILVKAIGVNSQSVLIRDKNTLSIGYGAGDSEASVTQNITLPDNGANGSTIVWTSSSPGVVSNTGVITRPAAGSPDLVVRLTATLTYNGITETRIFEITVKAKAQQPVVPTPSTSTTTVVSTPSTTITTVDTGVDVLVNGKVETAGTLKITYENGTKVATVVVDPQKLRERLEKEGKNAVITIPVKSDANIKIGELDGQMVKDMENQQSVVEVKTDTGSYFLPAQQINIDAISAQIGSRVELKDIKVQIEVSKSNDATVKIVQNSAKNGGFTIVAPAVDFTVKCTAENKTVEVKKFNAYVKRTIAIPDGIDPNKITTGVVVDPDGTSRHVPTAVTVENSQYYAVINSLTNSTYTVVWNPIEFKDAEKHWAKTAINDMGSRMVIDGVGEGMFNPDRAITRAEFAAIIVTALGLKPETGASKFPDVNTSKWYSKYINTAVEYNIIAGYTSGNFGPNDKITREQAMAMIGNAMKITGLKVELTSKQIEDMLSGFKDGSKAGNYAKTSIAACLKSGIVTGRSGGLIAPKATITRAEVAVIVRNLLQKSKVDINCAL